MKKNRKKHLKKCPEPTPQNAFVYIIQCCDGNGFVKIGITNKTAVSRVSELQVGCPYELKVIASFNVNGNLRKVESTLHSQLEQFRLRGEWFQLTPAKAVNFILASLDIIDDCGFQAASFETTHDKVNFVQDEEESQSDKTGSIESWSDARLLAVFGETLKHTKDEKDKYYSRNSWCQEEGLDAGFLSKMFNGIEDVTPTYRRRMQDFLKEHTMILPLPPR